MYVLYRILGLRSTVFVLYFCNKKVVLFVTFFPQKMLKNQALINALNHYDMPHFPGIFALQNNAVGHRDYSSNAHHPWGICHTG
jgi:hypothetical protein